MGRNLVLGWDWFVKHHLTKTLWSTIKKLGALTVKGDYIAHL